MNFNRRQNRIAGPGFHLNVRYDDQHMAMAHSQAQEVHPALNLGRNHKENFDVKEQELLVCKKTTAMYHDGYTHCFSSANGFSLDQSTLTSLSGASQEEVAEAVLSQVKFVGVATTEYKPSKAYSEQGFVAQVGGVTTLINESQTTIKPGDTVALGLNLTIGRKTSRDKGIPRDKIRFCVVKAGSSRTLAQQSLDCLGNSSTPQSRADTAKAQKELSKAQKELQKAKAGSQAETDAKKAIAAAESKLKTLKLCKGGIDGIMEFLDKYQELNERVIDNKFVNFTIFRDENEINIFFDIKNFNLIGWQTLDIYQNLNITYLSSLKKNQILRKNIFNLPEIN